MISVVMPVFNKEKYVHNILKDLQKQTFQNFECIIVDDGSTDRSGIICDEVGLIDERFQVIHIKNAGVSYARNVGLKEVRGNYITFIDADDRLESNYLKVLYEDITKSNADIIISGVEKWWEKTNFTELLKIPYQGKYKMKELLPKFAMVQKNTGIYGYCWGKLLKKELIEEVYFTNELKLAEDFDFYLQIYPKVDTIFFENNCHYFYLQEAQNSSMLSADNEIDYKAQLKINLRYRDFLKKMNSYNEYNRLLVDRILTNYVFFVVYHARRQEISKKVEEMNQIAYQENINLKGVGTIQNIILWCIKNKKGILAEKLLRIYDILRWFKRKSRLFL